MARAFTGAIWHSYKKGRWLMFNKSLLASNGSPKAISPRRDDFLFPLEQTFNKFFDEFFSTDNLDGVKGTGSYPKVNAYSNETEMVMHVSVSGVPSENLKVEVTPENILIVSGRMSAEYQTPKTVTNWCRHELRQSVFERHFKLPDDVEGDPVAKLKDGILTLRWRTKGRDAPQLVNKQIPIKSE